jgi:diguanylate cyclase (GGDEF)-like protein/PAS domain S-box-containing protein
MNRFLKIKYRHADVLNIIALTLTYIALAQVALNFFSVNGVVSVVWPSSGLALAGLLLGGRRYWLGVFIGAFAANVLAGSAVSLSFIIACGNTLEALTALWLLKRLNHFDKSLNQPFDYLYLILAASTSAWVSALIGNSALFLYHIVNLETLLANLCDWWIGDTLGIILVTPFILVWQQLPYSWFKPQRRLETVVGFALAFLVGQAVFISAFEPIVGRILGYWMFPFIAWAGVRCGRRGVLLLIVMIVIQGLYGFIHHKGFFGTAGLMNLTCYVLVLSFAGIGLNLMVKKRGCIEQALRLSEQRLLNAQRIVHLGHWEWNVTEDKLFWSEEMWRIFGFNQPLRYINYATFLECLHEDDRLSVEYAVDNALHQHHPFSLEYRICMPSGETRFVHAQAEVVTDKQATVIMRGTVQDITARKLTEQKLQLSEQRLITAQRIAHVGNWEWNMKHEQILWSSEMYQIFDLPQEGGINFSLFFNSIYLDDRQKVKDARDKALTGQQPYNITYRIYTSNGELRYLHAQAEVTTNALGEQLVIGATRDITEYKLAEQALVTSQQRLVTAQRIAHIGSWEWNLIDNTLHWSEEMYRIFHIEKNTTINYINAFDSVHSSDRKMIEEAVNNTIQMHQPYSIDYRIYLPNGELRYLHGQAEVIINAQGETILIGTSQDITERKQTEEALQLSALVYQNSSEAMMITDAQNNIIAINPAFTTLTGYSEQEVLGKNPRVRKSGHQTAVFYDDMYAALNASGQWQGEIWNRRKTGEIRAEWLSINTIYHQDGTPYRRVALFYDITQRKESEKLIWKQANFDLLTGLPNRLMFMDRLEQAIKKASHTNRHLVLLFLDLDRFKEINDSYGHSTGDVLLKEVALRLKYCLREGDTFARLGGDEFTIILSELAHVIDADMIAQCVLDQLNSPFKLGEKTIYISTSIGVTVYPNDALTAGDLLKNADQAMYAAKAAGRNRYHYFTPKMEQAAQKRMQLATDLRDALKENQFVVYYQPIVSIATGEIHKAEALIRWQHPKRGLISPADFIPIAEETGLIIDIGEWVFEQVIHQVAHWRTNYRADFQISINKSPIQFHHKRTQPHSWPEQLKNLGLTGDSIVVEITEGMLLDITDIITHKLSDFNAANMQVALDDFGTGYCSLGYLKRFDIDYLKIDQSYVQNLKHNSDDMTLCSAIIVMAHTLGIKVIAEGIETKEQLNLLKNTNCDYGQGYLFSRPVPAAEFERFFSNPPAL